MMRQLCSLVFVLMPFLAAFGQNTGRISGSVMDASGAAIPGASVKLFVAGGAAPIASMSSSNEGVFFFPALQPVYYDLSVEVKGFRTEIRRGLKVDAGTELSVPAYKLDVASQAEVVEVSAVAQGVQTSNAELATTITNDQVRRLPTLNRSPLALISTQAGVDYSGRANTTINGMRPSFTNITIDGINIQDNFIRTNTLDFQPNMLLLDQIGEFTVATSNTNASDGSGAAQIKFVTPSGSNKFRGNLFWQNRNNKFAANTWFNNRNGVARPLLKQNQAGGSLGGPIVKDKLFFYGNYELFRLKQQTAATRTILTADARNGIVTYLDTGNVRRQVNVLTAAGVAANSRMRTLIGTIPGPEAINRTDIGDSLNTNGYGFNVRNDRVRDNITGKVDYVVSSNHAISGTLLINKDKLDRPDLANNYDLVPKVSNDNTTRLISGTWRWTPTATLTNEMRGGFNFAPAVFATVETFGSEILTLPLVNNPLNTFRGQGRYTNTYNFQNNATWFRGKHTFAFGMQYQNVHADPFNDAGNLPGYTLGISTANAAGLSGTQLPGIRSSDLTIANSLLALHAGYVTSYAQTFNVTDRTSGYVSGAPSARKLRLQNWSAFFTDTWRVSRKLTVTLGTRWEYYAPVDEANSLVLLPLLRNNNGINTLMDPNGVLDFAGKSVGRPWYGKDFNNFSPNVGLAWQPFGDAKTVLRAGYSINFPNDDFIRSVDNNVITNAGLSQGVSAVNRTETVAGLPAIPTPAFKVPRTYADNYALSPTAAFGLPDPNLRTPYVQQWSFGIQREIAKGVLEVRYIGNRSTKQFRAFDYNQIAIKGTPYLDDFKKALNNGNLARAAGLGFVPSYNAAIAGSQTLPWLNSFVLSAGNLTNATVRGLIERGEAGELANIYQQNRWLQQGYSFYGNPNATGVNMMTNYSNANYNAGQVDYRRHLSSGLTFQGNYSFAKGMSDASGDAQTRFEPFLDMDNAKIERARTPFDLTHSFKVNGVWDIPVGKGRKLDIQNRIIDYMIGGWSASGIMTWTSGAPFSVFAPRNTLNRSGRSASNTATASVNKAALDSLITFRQTGAGPYFFAPSVLGADGRAAAPDGTPAFTGQVFFNPGPGSIGALQRRMFSGPAFWNTDFSVLKRFNVTESNFFEFRAEFFNLTNHPSFLIGDQDINSVNFGRITATASSRRIIQFGIQYRF